MYRYTTINSLSINLSTVRVLQTVAAFEDFPILPLTWNLKHGGWKTILSSWGPASWQVRTVSFRHSNIHKIPVALAQVAKHQLKRKWINDSTLEVKDHQKYSPLELLITNPY